MSRCLYILLYTQPHFYPAPLDVVLTSMGTASREVIDPSIGPGLCKMLDMDFREFHF
jgi:hypothetical protein